MTSKQGFTTEGSEQYFKDREDKLTEQLNQAQQAFDTVRATWGERIGAIDAKRVELESAIANVRTIRNALMTSRESALDAIDALLTAAAAAQEAIGEADKALLPPTQRSAELLGERAEAEKGCERQSNKPRREVDKLERRLAGLRARHAVVRNNSVPEERPLVSVIR